ARRRLPEYMVPAAVVLLDALPLAPTGKVDRRRLPAPEAEARERVAPRTPTEERLAEIWSGLLGVAGVGVTDDFFALGGHSLLATRMVARIREALGVELPLSALFNAPVLGDLAERVEARSGSTDSTAEILRVPRDGLSLEELLGLLEAGEAGDDVDPPVPASFAQERLWFLDRMEPGIPTYNLRAALRLQGSLDTAALERALAETVRRHEPLRTVLAEAEGGCVQVILPEAPVALPREELGALPEDEREDELRRRLYARSAEPFDLRAGPLFRARLLRLDPAEHVLLLGMHHAVADGWSIDVLHRELGALYGAFARGEPSPLPELPVRYADYAAWQREQLAGGALEEGLAWWRERLAGAPAVLELPTDRPRPAVPGRRGAAHPFEVEPGAAERLRSLARAEGATLFMALLAAFDVLLARYAGSDDVVVGTPVAGRTRPELEGLVGFFVNTLALRADLSGDPSFRDLLRRVRGDTLLDFAHQEVPFDRVVEALRPERSRSHSPLFQVMLVLQGAPGEAPAFGPLRARPERLLPDVAKFDLTLSLEAADGRLRGFLEYDAELFDGATAARMAGHFRLLLDGALRGPARPLSSVPLVDAEEERRVLEWGSGGAAEEARGCVHEWIGAQAERTPDATALVCGEERLSYAELRARTRRLARGLRGRGVGPEVRVGVALERGIDAVVALLAVLEAGGVYLPLDPAHPAERLAFVL
ncbi:MAG TPA: condensation domain-containing protein, partial [Longimicrobiaceae bacterium]